MASEFKEMKIKFWSFPLQKQPLYLEEKNRKIDFQYYEALTAEAAGLGNNSLPCFRLYEFLFLKAMASCFNNLSSKS